MQTFPFLRAYTCTPASRQMAHNLNCALVRRTILTLLHVHCLLLSPTSNNTQPGKKCPATDFFPRCCMQGQHFQRDTHTAGFLPFHCSNSARPREASASAFSPACLLPLSFSLFLAPSRSFSVFLSPFRSFSLLFAPSSFPSLIPPLSRHFLPPSLSPSSKSVFGCGFNSSEGEAIQPTSPLLTS